MSLKIDICDTETVVGENSARYCRIFSGMVLKPEYESYLSTSRTDRGVSRQKRYGSLYMYHRDSQ